MPEVLISTFLTTNLGFQTFSCPKLMSSILLSGAQSTLSTLEKLFNRKIIDLDPCGALLIVQKGQ